MAADMGIGRDTLMAHYLSNHVAVAYGDIFDEMVALSQELGFKVRILGTRRRDREASRRPASASTSASTSAPAARAPAIFDGAGTQARARHRAHPDLPPRGGLRRAVVGRHLARLRHGGARGARRSRHRRRAPERVAGIGFDATCSLVALDADDRPVTRQPDRPRRTERDRLDGPPRASTRPRAINATGHDVLRYVGGTISPEMETPKLLWLKKNLPEQLAARRALLRSARLSDLPRDRRSTRARSAPPSASGRTSVTRVEGQAAAAGTRRSSGRSASAISPTKGSRKIGTQRAPDGRDASAGSRRRPRASSVSRRAPRSACRSSTRTPAASGCSGCPSAASRRPPRRSKSGSR